MRQGIAGPRRWRCGVRAGFSLLELLLVIAIIAFLIAGLFTAVSKLRTRTALGQTKNLLEKLHNAMETYNLNFRAYPVPPDATGTLVNNQALYLFLASGFRKGASVARGEVEATVNVGPLVKFEERDLKEVAGVKTIRDPWGSHLGFKVERRTFTDPVDATKSTKVDIPIIWSFGINTVNDLEGMSPPGDDIIVGAQ